MISTSPSGSEEVSIFERENVPPASQVAVTSGNVAIWIFTGFPISVQVPARV